MKKLIFLVFLVLLSSSAAPAQDNELPAPREQAGRFAPQLSPRTNHESSYERYTTARELVHRNAALRAAQRRERMAINARFGYSPSRPPASTVPSMGSPILPPTAFYVPYPGFVFPRAYSRF